MKIGDLVRFKKLYYDGRSLPGLNADHSSFYTSKLGIILDESPKYYFVSWIGDKQPYVCERKHALELAK